MPGRLYVTSRPDPWVQPRPFSDASTRLQKHGPIEPMPGTEPGLLEKIVTRMIPKRRYKSRRR